MKCKFVALVAVFSVLALTSCSDQPSTATSEHNEAMKEVVRQAGASIDARDYETLAQFHTTDYLRHSQATPGAEDKDFEDFVTFLKQGVITFPDDRAIYDLLVVEGDLVAFWGRYEGTNTGPGPFPPTGKFMSIDMAGIHRIKDGKIAETWVTWDNTVMFTQLGIPMAPPASSESD